MTTATTICLDDVMERISRVMARAYHAGQGWYYVRVWPDGSITDGCEVSRCIPESEYNRTGRPHPVTVWGEQQNAMVGPGDGAFEWEECDESEATFFANADRTDYAEVRSEEFPVPCKLSMTWVSEPDLDHMRDGIARDLTEAGYEVE